MMKKVFLLLCLLATTTIATATDLWEGTHAVDWSNTLTIEAAKFADAQVGQKIVVEFKDATGEVIELHSTCLKEHGMEICGKGFTATKVWYGDGKDNVDGNTVWTGYFWMDEWSTLEVAKTSFDGINWSDYKAIRFYSEANRTDYVINVLTKWGDGGKLGDQTTMTMTNEYVELSLEGIDMTAKLADVDRLMVQCNKEGGNPFNFTAIVLVKKETTGVEGGNPFNFTAIVLVKKETTGVSATLMDSEKVDGKAYNLAGQHVDSPSKGLYIVNGKKVLVKKNRY